MSRLKLALIIFTTIIIVGVVSFYCFKVLYPLNKTTPAFTCGVKDDRFIDGVTDSSSCLGKTLFKKNCAACHNASSVKSTGPGLWGVLGRIPSREWLYEWVRNSNKLIKSGDAYANAIYHEYNETQQTIFGNTLSNKEIDAIIEYVDVGRCR
jgi:cytochrome c2